MTIIERLQGAALFLFFAALCGLMGRSVIRESRIGTLAAAVESTMVVEAAAPKRLAQSADETSETNATSIPDHPSPRTSLANGPFATHSLKP